MQREQGLVEKGSIRMLGWQIFVHSVRMVFGNLKQVLQIVVVPALAGFLLAATSFWITGVPLEVFDDSASGLPADVSSASYTAFMMLLVLSVALTGAWMVIAWHRYVLLEEYPRGMVPPFRVSQVFNYVGRWALLILIVVAILILPFGIINALANSLPLIVILVLYLLLVLGVAICFFRLAIVLPSTAIGKQPKFSEAWAATEGSNGTVLTMIVVLFLFQLVVQLVFSAALLVPLFGPLLVLFATFLIIPMINISILTTMYGIFVEKRELS